MAFILKDIEELNNSGLSGQLSVNDEMLDNSEWSYGQYNYLLNYEQYKAFYESVKTEPVLIDQIKLRSTNYNQVDTDIEIVKSSLGNLQIKNLPTEVFIQSTFPYAEINTEIALNNKERIGFHLEENSNLNLTFDYQQMDRREDFLIGNEINKELEIKVVQTPITETQKKKHICKIIVDWVDSQLSIK